MSLPITHNKQHDVWTWIKLLSSKSQKISKWKNLARVAADDQNDPGF